MKNCDDFSFILIGFCPQITAYKNAEKKEERKKKSQQMVWVGVCWMELYYMWCNKMMFQTSQETRVLLFTLLLLAGDVERNPGPQQKGSKANLKILKGGNQCKSLETSI